MHGSTGVDPLLSALEICRSEIKDSHPIATLMLDDSLSSFSSVMPGHVSSNINVR
jgi:hypothetical protein